ncbi:MFS transporter [Azospirillum sp. RWY-5-1]|uniref:MFS transporter n=1 Tax=Azospirillum oleiclasticum TaxID=2735135 RepID=A0ABX2T667_9PROT|nr:MFS transporter [Azospirillum oleiclasticum]NYZ11278.1 MFS transporter [Azospirillum oleiclasticum]NYZ18439.1 MFS transporter [Azospirillum oleiclasticum]
MGDRSARLAVGFSWAGHTIMHLVAALYLTVVLALEKEWGLSYDELIRLWTVGALLIGLGAPLAGWLGDRWSENGMMAVFFLMTGAGAIGCGLARNPDELWLALAVLGLGASIYHPVSMSVVVRNATDRGKAMGWLGIFGTVGIACAGITAGALTDLAGWRAAFLVPGAVCAAFGVALTVLMLTGVVYDREGDRKPQAAPSRGDVYRAFIVLSVTMVCAGLMFNAMQVVLPKLFELRLDGLVGEGTLGIGGLVTLVYLVAAVPQLIGGHLADRYPLKRIYLLCLIAQVPLMALLAVVTGMPVVAAAAAVVISSQIQIPAENLLLARYTPARHRGLAFGAKFVLSFGAGPVAVQMAAWFYERFTGFEALYLTLAALGVVAAAAAVLLPDEGAKAAAPAVPAMPATAAGGD